MAVRYTDIGDSNDPHEASQSSADSHPIPASSAEETPDNAGPVAEHKYLQRDDVDRYRILAELVPHLVWILDRDGLPVYLNQRTLDFTGCSVDEVDKFGWIDWVADEDRERVANSFSAAFEAGVAFGTACRLRGVKGDPRWFMIRTVPIPNGKSGSRGWVGTATDIHEEKRKEEIQRFLAGLDHAMRIAPTPDDALLRVVTMLGEYLSASYCAYQENQFFDDYAIMTVRQDYHVPGLRSLVGQYHSDIVAPAIKSLSALGGTVVISNVSTDARMNDYTAYFEDNGYRAILYVPIMRGGIEVADLSVVQSVPREWREDEVALLEAVAERTWLALDSARFYNENLRAVARQRAFARDVLASVTDGRLRVCESAADLPEPLAEVGEHIDLKAGQGMRDIRHLVRDLACSLDFGEDRINDLMTAAGEATMNAVVHARNGVAWVCSDSETIQVWVVDSGTGIDIEKLPQATLVRGFSTAGTLGHGFKMILQAIDCVYLLTRNTGTTVVLKQSRTPPEPVF